MLIYAKIRRLRLREGLTIGICPGSLDVSMPCMLRALVYFNHCAGMS